METGDFEYWARSMDKPLRTISASFCSSTTISSRPKLRTQRIISLIPATLKLISRHPSGA